MITQQEKQRRIEAAAKRVNAIKERIEKLDEKRSAAMDEMKLQVEQFDWIRNAPTSD